MRDRQAALGGQDVGVRVSREVHGRLLIVGGMTHRSFSDEDINSLLRPLERPSSDGREVTEQKRPVSAMELTQDAVEQRPGQVIEQRYPRRVHFDATEHANMVYCDSMSLHSGAIEDEKPKHIAPGDIRRVIAGSPVYECLADALNDVGNIATGTIRIASLALIITSFEIGRTPIRTCLIIDKMKMRWTRLYDGLPEDEEC